MTVKEAKAAFDAAVKLDRSRRKLWLNAERKVRGAKRRYLLKKSNANKIELARARGYRNNRKKLYAQSTEDRAKKRAAWVAAKKKASRPLRVRALAEARSMLGTLEHGGNNRGTVVDKIIKANGGDLGEAWCGDAVAYWYRNAGSTVVTRAWAAAHAGIWGWFTGVVRLRSLKNLKPGQIVEYNWQHTGLFEKWIDKNAGTFYAIEGNTGAQGNTSDTNADGIRRRTRNINDVAGAFSPQR